MVKHASAALSAVLVLLGCSSEETGPAVATTTSASGGASTTSVGGAGGSTVSSGGSGGSGGDSTGVGAGSSACDYQVVNGAAVIEAESLALVDDWQVGSMHAGFSGTGYIEWTGASSNAQPGNGRMDVAVNIPAAGRYRIQWHTRIGMGSDTTEHNDTWVKFPDALDWYGLRFQNMLEERRYSKPRCDDANFISMIEALPEVSQASCVQGSTADDWYKVYCSGAADWRWSTRTSDNEGFEVVFETDSPGTYTLSLSARADFHLIDRIVLHEYGLDDNVVQDLALPETPCP